MHKVTRLRAVRIVAAAAGLPLLIAGVRAAQPKPRFFSWQGEVLGAASVLTLWHSDEALVRRMILKARHEIARCENIFSLYRDSEVTRLNRDGIVRPSPELVEVVDASQRLGAISGGAFDVTVQPLWRVYEQHFWSRSEVVPDIAARALDVARAQVDFRRVQAGASASNCRPAWRSRSTASRRATSPTALPTCCATRGSSTRWSTSASGARLGTIPRAVHGAPRRAKAVSH